MRTTGWTVPWRFVALGAPLLGMLVSCGDEPTASSAAPAAGSGGPGTVAIGVTTPTGPVADADDAPDVVLVAACEEWIRFQSYVGDPEGVELWNAAGGTEAGVAATCTDMARSDTGRVEVMQEELDLMAEAAAAEASAAASTTLAPGCHPDYGDCLPIVTDIDCQGAGDGPVFVALSVIVFGDDPYELDGDQDGLACEPGDR